MGEVYRAQDTRLRRDVAIKVLPETLAADPERRRRFAQEARATAALAHPNILVIYDVGEHGGAPYLAMELLKGETLRARLASGPLPAGKAAAIATQIARGLAAASDKGIIHRDLKPENLFLTHDGVVKILDFGLARLTHAEPGTAGASLAATTTAVLTHTGQILGTVGYLSPEQVRGEPADARSDVFALGCVLYEMLSGRRAFTGVSPAETLSSILRDEPSTIAGTDPLLSSVEGVALRCLAKRPEERYQTAREISAVLEALGSLRDHLSEVAQPQAAAVAASRRARRWPVAMAAAFGLGLVLAFAAWWFLMPEPLPDQSNYRFTPFGIDPGGQSGGVWSPDGKSVAYTSGRYGGSYGGGQIFVRNLDSDVPAQVTRIPEPAWPIAWTPDGHRILFQTWREPAGVWSVAAVGGEPGVVLADNEILSAAASPDGRALAVLRPGDDGQIGIWISAPAGSPLKKYTPDPFATPEVVNISSLKFSPDGNSILLSFTSRTGFEAWLIPYPPDRGRPPRKVLPEASAHGGIGSFSWMPDSRHVVLSFQPSLATSRQLWMADVIKGKLRALTSGGTFRGFPAVSPDGQRIVFTERGSDFNVVSATLDGSVRPLIATGRSEQMPAWAAKQPVLVYVTDRNGPSEIWIRSGGLDRSLVTARDFLPAETQWFMGPALSPDADRVAYTRSDAGDVKRLWISAVAGGSPVPLTNDTSTELAGSWSPDGGWFAYTRINNGKTELMKVKTTGQTAPVMLKSDAVFEIPSWSPTGDWIAFGGELISPDGKTTRPLGEHGSRYYMFSVDGKMVYGIRADGDRSLLFAVEIASGAEQIIGDLGTDFLPAAGMNPGIRFSLAPDGRSFVYSTATHKSDLWLLEGFAERRGRFAR
jgi:Tol biopolymer transport system component